MKKIVFLLLASVFFLFGCQSNSSNESAESKAANENAESKQPKVIGKDGVARPDWVTKGKKDAEFHYEVGDGKLANFSNSKVRAESAARDKIALWIQTDVQVVLKNYTQDAGIGDKREVIDFMERVSKQSAEVSLRGISFDDVWESTEGNVYVLAAIPLQSVTDSLDALVKKEAGSFARQEQAAFAEFKAKEAFSALEASKTN